MCVCVCVCVCVYVYVWSWSGCAHFILPAHQVNSQTLTIFSHKSSLYPTEEEMTENDVTYHDHVCSFNLHFNELISDKHCIWFHLAQRDFRPDILRLCFVFLSAHFVFASVAKSANFNSCSLTNSCYLQTSTQSFFCHLSKEFVGTTIIFGRVGKC